MLSSHDSRTIQEKQENSELNKYSDIFIKRRNSGCKLTFYVF